MNFLFKNGNNKIYNKRIIDVAERLHKEAEKIRMFGNKVEIEIGWEEFTVDYMKDSLPCTDLETRLWVEKRANCWKDDVNQQFILLAYPEWLFVVPRKGLKLVLDSFASFKVIITSLKKECSIQDRKSRLLRDFAECFTGKTRREMVRMSDHNVTMIKYMAGLIALDPILNKNQKSELLDVINDYVN